MDTATKKLENDHLHILKLVDIMKCIVQSKEPDVEYIEKVNTLSDTEQKNLLDKFDDIERNRADGEKVGDYVNQIDDLALFYGV